MSVLLKYQCLLFVFAIILTTYTLSASAGPAKDKKKLLDKLRNALNQTELEEAGNSTLEVSPENLNVTVEVVADPEAKSVEDDDSSGKLEDDSEGGPESDKKQEDVDKTGTELEKVESSVSPVQYLLKVRSILRRLFDMFGFRTSKKKEGRQNRMLSNDDSYTYNGLEYEYFKDDIRTTVGAVLGEKECIQKIVCGAGSYLRSVNGKNVILTVLENVTPSGWVDTMEVLKQSAITDGDCQYKCLEGGDDHVVEI